MFGMIRQQLAPLQLLSLWRVSADIYVALDRSGLVPGAMRAGASHSTRQETFGLCLPPARR